MICSQKEMETAEDDIKKVNLEYRQVAKVALVAQI